MGKGEIALVLGGLAALAVGLYLLVSGKLKLPSLTIPDILPIAPIQPPEEVLPTVTIPTTPPTVVSPILDIFGVNGGAFGVGDTIVNLVTNIFKPPPTKMERYWGQVEELGIRTTPIPESLRVMDPLRAHRMIKLKTDEMGLKPKIVLFNGKLPTYEFERTRTKPLRIEGRMR